MGTHLGMRTSRMAAVAALATMLFALLPAAPASAAGLTVVFQGELQLDAGDLACGSGRIQASAIGTHGSTPVVNAPVTANFMYCHGVPNGTASGQMTIAGHRCDLQWELLGIMLVMSLRNCTYGGTPHAGGSAVAQFIPTSAPGSVPCRAVLVGEAVFDTSK
jgi:hypothetical protein